jgi:hypothetical protein
VFVARRLFGGARGGVVHSAPIVSREMLRSLANPAPPELPIAARRMRHSLSNQRREGNLGDRARRLLI